MKKAEERQNNGEEKGRRKRQNKTLPASVLFELMRAETYRNSLKLTEPRFRSQLFRFGSNFGLRLGSNCLFVCLFLSFPFVLAWYL
jgi:hypothetical protein